MQYLYPQCTVIVDDDERYVETRFPDGATVGCTPNDDDHSRRLAEDLGYGNDTWSMSKDHELAHTWLAHHAGQPWSSTRWRVAHPAAIGAIGDVEVSEEEASVLEFQRELVKDAPRPWDCSAVPVRVALPW